MAEVNECTLDVQNPIPYFAESDLKLQLILDLNFHDAVAMLETRTRIPYWSTMPPT